MTRDGGIRNDGDNNYRLRGPFDRHRPEPAVGKSRESRRVRMKIIRRLH